MTDNNEITDACFQWCKEQHFANDMSSLWILIFALALLLIHYIITHFHEEISQAAEIKEKTLDSSLSALTMAIFFLLAAFLFLNGN